jgi:hypothetical protein
MITSRVRGVMASHFCEARGRTQVGSHRAGVRMPQSQPRRRRQDQRTRVGSSDRRRRLRTLEWQNAGNQKCPRNLRLQPEALPPWTEKNSLRSRERAVKAYRTKNAVFRKITAWRLKLGERADKVSIPPSVAFRAITRSPRRPAARADMPHIAGRTSQRPRMRHSS